MPKTFEIFEAPPVCEAAAAGLADTAALRQEFQPPNLVAGDAALQTDRGCVPRGAGSAAARTNAKDG
jgi:hypothetical protein